MGLFFRTYSLITNTFYTCIKSIILLYVIDILCILISNNSIFMKVVLCNRKVRKSHAGKLNKAQLSKNCEFILKVHQIAKEINGNK